VANPPDSSPTTRQRLLEAAFEVFAEKGYAGTRVQEIAKRAGFTTGAIYANFSGKAALLGEAIGSQGLSALQASMWAIKTDRDAADILRELGVLSIVAKSHPVDVLSLDALAAAARDPDVAGLIKPQLERWLDALRELLDDSAAKGEIDTRFTTEALVTLGAGLALGSFVLRALDLTHPSQDEADAVIKRLISAFRVNDPWPDEAD
jgi:AcrR family transcriptional regulator